MNTIVDQIIRDLKGRKGFQQAWESLSDEDRRDLTMLWASYEEAAFDKVMTNQQFELEQILLQIFSISCSSLTVAAANPMLPADVAEESHRAVEVYSQELQAFMMRHFNKHLGGG